MTAAPDSLHMPFGKMLGSIGRAHACLMDQFTEKLGIFRGQAVVLLTLLERDGMTHSEIAEKLSISHPAASKMLKRLEQQGYIRRQTDPNDERVSRVYIQEAGKALTQELRPYFRQVNEIMVSGFSEQEREQLWRYLLRVQENLLNYEEYPDGS